MKISFLLVPSIKSRSQLDPMSKVTQFLPKCEVERKTPQSKVVYSSKSHKIVATCVIST